MRVTCLNRAQRPHGLRMTFNSTEPTCTNVCVKLASTAGQLEATRQVEEWTLDTTKIFAYVILFFPKRKPVVLEI